LLKRGQIGTAIEIIGGLLIGALLVFLGIKIYAAVMGQGDKYFDLLDKEIKSLKDKSEQEAKNTFPVVLDDGTAILGFTAARGDIQVKYSFPMSIRNVFGTNSALTFYRPQNCPDGKSCLCLCSSIDISQIPLSPHTYYTCIRPVCKTYDNVIFTHNKICNPDTINNCIYDPEENDFALIKDLRYQWTPDVISASTNDEKWQQVALEKIGNTLVVCNKFPCSQQTQIREELRLTEVYFCLTCSTPFWALREKYTQNNVEYYNFYPITKLESSLKYTYVRTQTQGLPSPEIGITANSIRQKQNSGEIIPFVPIQGIENKIMEYRQNGNPVGHCVIKKLREGVYIQYKINSLRYDLQQRKLIIEHDENVICPTPLNDQNKAQILGDITRAALVEYITQDQISVPPGSASRNAEQPMQEISNTIAGSTSP